MADNPKPINADYSVDGQITLDGLKQAADQGFRSILNLRSPAEVGFLAEEADQASSLGLDYANAPVDGTIANAQQLQKALSALDSLPKPVLIHCRGGVRASVVALMAIALQENQSFESFIQSVQDAGVELDHPQIRHFIQERYPDHSSTL